MAENLPTERENEKRGRGRPSKASDALKAEICRRLIDGEPMADICRDDHMPSPNTVTAWMTEDTEFSAVIMHARELGGDRIAANARRTARGDEGYTTGDVQRDKLVVETDLKLLAKWHPKRYGDRIDVTSGGEKLEASDGLSLQQAAKLAAILAEAEKRKGSDDAGND